MNRELEATPATDPFFYGYRYVQRALPDGTTATVQEPLTEEDVLYPQEEDHVMQSHAHVEDCIYLKTALDVHLRNRPNCVVLCDCRVAWNDEGSYAHGPDIAVFLNLTRPLPERLTTFNTFVEGCRPDLIIEVISPATQATDLTRKVRDYQDLELPLFVMVDDNFAVPRQLTLVGYAPNGPSGYSRFGLDATGRLPLVPLALALGVEQGRLRLWDAAGTPLLTPKEQAETVVAAARQVKKAQRQTKNAERRTKTAVAARQDAQRQAAAADAARQESDRRAATADAARHEADRRAADLAERLRLMEEQLRHAAKPPDGGAP